MSLPDFQQRAVKMMTMTTAQQQAEMEADANLVKILKDQGLTAKEYMVGGPALRMAMLIAEGNTSPNIYASPENLAFAKKNMAVLKPRADSVEAMMKRPPVEIANQDKRGQTPFDHTAASRSHCDSVKWSLTPL
jgi:saccharopine dehydrogenase-like NADP-dependent oxidoreductase